MHGLGFHLVPPEVVLRRRQRRRIGIDAERLGQPPAVSLQARLGRVLRRDLAEVPVEGFVGVFHDGPAGLGGTTGSIAQKDASEARYPPLAPNLTAPLTVGRTDGYLYALIWVGRGLMPAYGPRIPHRERWAIVHYVRQLQAVAAQQPGGGN